MLVSIDLMIYNIVFLSSSVIFYYLMKFLNKWYNQLDDGTILYRWIDDNTYNVYRVWEYMDNDTVHTIKVEIEDIDVYYYYEILEYISENINDLTLSNDNSAESLLKYDRLYILPSVFDKTVFESDIYKKYINEYYEYTSDDNLNKEFTCLEDTTNTHDGTTVTEGEQYKNSEYLLSWLRVYYKIK